MTPEQLKASILQYAIQGKLVEQRPEEGTAEELYNQICIDRENKIKAKLIKRDKRASLDDMEEEKPFDIPENWKWVTLGSILLKLTDGTHKTPKYSEQGIKFVSVKDMSSGVLSLDNTKFITEEEHKELYNRCDPQKGDMLLSKVGTTGVPAIIDTDEQFSLFVSVALLKYNHEYINEKYLYYLLLSPLVQKQASENTRGVGNKNWVLDAIGKTLITLPPYKEQRRIVAKIEELLPFVDRYAASYEKLEQFNAKFPEDMKKSILQYAIQGKLVEQRPEEGTAEELYQQIQKEKQKLIKEGKIKKEKPLAEITEDEIPFDIPDSWKWCRLQDICTLIADVDHNMPKAVPASVGKLFLSAKDLLDDGTINYTDNVKYISNEDFERLSKKAKPTVKDIIYSRIGAALGKARVVESDVEFIVSYSCCVIRTLIDEKYLRYYLESPLILRHSVLARQSIGVPDLGMGEIKQYIVALPPIEEQKRIVAKITEILPYCDRLVK